MRAILKAILPHSLFALFGALLGGLSITALINKSYDDGFISALDVLVRYYDRLISILFGWAKEPLEAFLRTLIHIDVELNPIWTHVSVLSGIYLLRNVHRLYAFHRPAAATYQLIFALPIMVFSGVGAGASYYPGGGFFSEVGVALFPLLGIFVMATLQGFWFATFPRDRQYRTWPDFGGTWLHFVGMQTWYGLGLFTGGLALSMLFTFLLILFGIPNPAILVLLLLVICLAIYWLAVGAEIARALPANSEIAGSPRIAHLLKVLDTPAARLSIAMIHTVIAFILMVLVNAGMGLLGL